MFKLRFKFSLVVVGTTGFMACSSDSADSTGNDAAQSTGPATTSTLSTTAASSTTGSTSAAVTTATASSASSSATVGSTTGGSTTGGSTTASSATVGSTTGGSTTGTATSSGAGGMGSTGSMSGAGGASTTGGGDEDFDPQPEDFTCIADWQAILGFRINNFLGHLEEAVAVAENPEGGVYPVGTILQHFPTEAMVKRRAGFSPETKDWEFFLLTLNQDGTTTIADRGTTEITTMGDTCASCHTKADAQWDFVCNTYGDANDGNPNCGFDLMPAQLDPPIANDPRCD